MATFLYLWEGRFSKAGIATISQGQAKCIEKQASSFFSHFIPNAV
jgi:hypothetical protein